MPRSAETPFCAYCYESLKETLLSNAYRAESEDHNPDIDHYCCGTAVAMVMNSPVLQDEIGPALATSAYVHFAVVWWQDASGEYVYNLYSVSDFDTTWVSGPMGGGGHAKASWFRSRKHPLEIFPPEPT